MSAAMEVTDYDVLHVNKRITNKETCKVNSCFLHYGLRNKLLLLSSAADLDKNAS